MSCLAFLDFYKASPSTTTRHQIIRSFRKAYGISPDPPCRPKKSNAGGDRHFGRIPHKPRLRRYPSLLCVQRPPRYGFFMSGLVVDVVTFYVQNPMTWKLLYANDYGLLPGKKKMLELWLSPQKFAHINCSGVRSRSTFKRSAFVEPLGNCGWWSCGVKRIDFVRSSIAWFDYLFIWHISTFAVNCNNCSSLAPQNYSLKFKFWTRTLTNRFLSEHTIVYLLFSSCSLLFRGKNLQALS